MTPEQEAILAKAKARKAAKGAVSKEPKVEPAVGMMPLTADKRSAIEDIGIGLVTGVNKGVASIPGIPGSIQQLARAGDEYLRDTRVGKFMGIDKAPQFPTLPTMEDTISGFEQLTGELPEPQTRPGQYAEAVGQFLPGAGGARAVTKLGSAALLGGLSEGGADIGRAVGGPSGEAVGRAAGTAAGLLKVSGGRPNILKEAKKIEGVPATAAAAKSLKDAGYGIVKRDVQAFDPDAYNNRLVEGIRILRQEGYDIQNTPALRKFIQQHGAKEPIRAMKMETARQKANKWSSSKDIGKARVGAVMRGQLDTHIGDTLLGQRPDLASGIVEGRLNTRSYKLGKDIEKRIKAGEGAEDVMSSLRTRFRTYGANNEAQLPKELNQAIDEFLDKPLLQRGTKHVAAALRSPLNLGLSALGGIKGFALGMAGKAAGHGIKALQEHGAVKKANLVKKIALMQPHQRALLAQRLARSTETRRKLLLENLLLSAGAQEK